MGTHQGAGCRAARVPTERAPGVACGPTRSPPLALHQRANPVAAGGEEPLLLLLGVAQEVAVAVGDEDAQRYGLQHGRRHDRGARRDHHREDGEDFGEHVLGHGWGAATAVVDLLLLLPIHHAQDGRLGDAARAAGAPRAEDALQLSRGVQVVRDGDEVGLPRYGVGIIARVEAHEGVDYDLALRPATVMGHRSDLPRGGLGYMRVRLHGRWAGLDGCWGRGGGSGAARTASTSGKSSSCPWQRLLTLHPAWTTCACECGQRHPTTWTP